MWTVVYQRGTGRIVHAQRLNLGPQVAACLTPSAPAPDRHYIDPVTGAMHERPALEARLSTGTIVGDGHDTARLAPLPPGCEVTVGDRKFRVADGVLDISSEGADEIEIAVDHFPFLPATWTLTATAAGGEE